MTKLAELKATRRAAQATYDAAWDVYTDTDDDDDADALAAARHTYVSADEAYKAELKKSKEGGN
jgi:hypothetical protein